MASAAALEAERVERRDRRDDLVDELLRHREDSTFDDLSPDAKLTLFERFVACLILEDRKTAMHLLDHERTILADYFAGARETLVLIPKKNGKTTLVAALMLFHMLTTGDCYCVVAAASIKQAGTLYRQATGFIKRSGLGSWFLVRAGTREIRSETDEGLIQVLAADADTADGVIPSLAIVDELHRHRSADLYHVFRDGLTPRNGQIITISTAGDDEESPLGKMRNAAMAKYREVKGEGAYKMFRSDDGSFVLHEWSLDLKDDRSDMALVKSANPAPWHTIEALKERFDSPSTTAWQWARFACNVWYPLNDDPAIRPEEWETCRRDDAHIEPGDVMLGIDFGWKNKSDCTAIVPYQWHGEDRQTIGQPVILVPTGDGSMLDDRAIEEAILVFNGKQYDRDAFEYEMARDNDPTSAAEWADAIENAVRVKITGIVYDPNQGGQQFCQQLERRHRLPFIAFDQRVSALARADGQFTEAVRRRTIEHNWSSDARQHVMNAVAVPVAGGAFYFGRPKVGPRKPTDALRAASIVHSVVLVADGKPKADRPKGSRGAHAFL